MTPPDVLHKPHLTVQCAGLGSLTWVRPGEGLRHKAMLNTTGFKVRSRELRNYCDRERSAGVVRFNCDRTPPIIYFTDVIGDVYRTNGVERVGTQNRLCLSSPVSNRLQIDCYLVAINLTCGETGLINWRHDRGQQHFFSGRVHLISASEIGHRQQLLVLMWPGSLVTTTHRRLELSWILEHQKLSNR